MSSQDELLKVFDELRNALMKCELPKLQAIYAEDYRGFNVRGEEENRELVFKYYTPGGVQLSLYEVSDLHISVLGEVGIITGKGRIRGRYAGYDFEHYLRFTDIFINRDSRWQYFISQATEIVP